MLNVVCVNWRNYQGRGVEYVNILHDMVARNLPQNMEGRFIVFTDDMENIRDYEAGTIIRRINEPLEGYYNKLYLFKGGLFPADERILYFDLDNCITGGLDGIASYNGRFAILEDVLSNRYNSSVMAWESGFGSEIYERYLKLGKPHVPGGDQDFIWDSLPDTPADMLQILYPNCFKSFRIEAQFAIPNGCKVVYFHGFPKQHAIKDGWVPLVWKKGGVSVFDNKVVGNTDDKTILDNINDALAKKYDFVTNQLPAHDSHAVFVGGGPSAADHIEDIRLRAENGQVIVAMNGSARWLAMHGIEADYHVMLDARAENIGFVPAPEYRLEMERLYCAQCHPEVLKKAGPSLVCWLPYADGLPQALEGHVGAYIGGGSSVGLKALSLFWLLGYRAFHLYGYDSCYRVDETGAQGVGHAYAQPLNEGERLIKVEVAGQQFITAPWMATQAQEFRELAFNLINERKCEITIHGEGLLPTVARRLNERIPPDSINEIDGVWWPTHDTHGRMASVEVVDLNDALAFLPENRRFLAIQAGGNVGIWAREMSKTFEKVLTFEPDPINFRCLELNLHELPKIIAANAALGDKSGSIEMDRIQGNCGAHSVAHSGTGIPVITIDSLGLSACDLIQLDVEGYEFSALTGARATIERFHPVIMTEEKGLGKKYDVAPAAISDYLGSLGYRAATKVNNDVIYTFQPQP